MVKPTGPVKPVENSVVRCQVESGAAVKRSLASAQAARGGRCGGPSLLPLRS